MSAAHLTALWAARLGGNAGVKLVAARLADRANKDTGADIYLSVPTIARDTGLSQRQVKRHLQRLLALGVLVVVKRSAQHSATHYAMPLDRLQALAKGDADDTSEESSSDTDDTSGNAQGCHTRHPGVTYKASRGVTGDTQDDHRRRKASMGGEAAARAADALTRTARAAPPADSCTDAWSRLQEVRPDLDYTLIAEAARVHYIEPGRPPQELVDALRKLTVTPQWKALPVPQGSAKRKPKAKQPIDDLPQADQPPAKPQPTEASKAAIAKLQAVKQKTEVEKMTEASKWLRDELKAHEDRKPQAVTRALEAMFGDDAAKADKWMKSGRRLPPETYQAGYRAFFNAL